MLTFLPFLFLCITKIIYLIANKHIFQNNAKFSAFQIKYPVYNCITAPLYPSKSANFVEIKVHSPFVAIEFFLLL